MKQILTISSQANSSNSNDACNISLPNNDKLIGSTLKILRESRRLSQNELAKDLGIKQAALSLIENGERVINDDLMKSFANYFDVPLEYLYLQQLRSKLHSNHPLLKSMFDIVDEEFNTVASNNNRSTFNRNKNIAISKDIVELLAH